MPRAFGLGALWGWLPCGMVYAVLLTALALGTWWEGALLMLAFGAGTLPNLLGIGFVSSTLMMRVRRNSMPRIAAGCIVAVFGVYSLGNVLHSTTGADGVLCHVIPGLDRLLH